ncbi:MAG: hypothetical protein HY741_27845 [Chloroflexi bacterium]|nr:hypothetical protein [Chloroflexota bacterium]
MNFARDPVRIVISAQMLRAAELAKGLVQVNRTIASPIDTLTGILGEMVWAQYYFGDWQKHNLVSNRGKSDFAQVEIKTSAFRFNPRLNLLVREDYSAKRAPKFYVQIIIDIEPKNPAIAPNTNAYICGYATADEVANAPLRDENKKGGGAAGYRCKFIPILKLHPISELPKDLKRI